MGKIVSDKDENEVDTALSIGNILDSLLRTSDGINIGRVTNLRLECCEDGTVRPTHLLVGPQALAGRLHPSLRSLARFLLRDRFDTAIPLSDVEKFGPTLHLRRKAIEYATGNSERWLAAHILRWIPGSGYTHEIINHHPEH